MAERILTGVLHWHFPWKQFGFAVLALVLVAAIAIPALNATTDLFSGRNAPVAQPGETGVNVGPAPVNNSPAQNPNPGVNVPEPSLIPLSEVEWTQPEGDYASLRNANEQDMRAAGMEWFETQEWFQQEVTPNIQSDPWFLTPVRLEDGSSILMGAALRGLKADGNVWVATVMTDVCDTERSWQPCVLHRDSQYNQWFGRGTIRLLVSTDAGENWGELIPPPGYRDGNFWLATEEEAFTVFNDGNAARVIVFIFRGPVYQATVPVNSPPAK